MVVRQITVPPSVIDSQAPWRDRVADVMEYNGMLGESLAFRHCRDGDYYHALAVCENNLSHFAKPILHTCHNRGCEDCERIAQADRLERYLPAITDVINLGKPSESLKHIVLTTRYSVMDDDIDERLRESWNALIVCLERAFYKLAKHKATSAERRRQRVSLKRLGWGAIATCEFGEQGHKLHFHILFYGGYIPKPLLDQEWQKATRGAGQITWITRVKDPQDGAKEVLLKYITKFSEMPPLHMVRMLLAIKGIRRVRSYGIFHGIPGDEHDSFVCCPVCDGALVYMHRLDYELACKQDGLYFSSYSGNNSGENKLSNGQRNGKDPPSGQPDQPFLTGMDTESMPIPSTNHYLMDTLNRR